jgi:hypothetical protein
MQDTTQCDMCMEVSTQNGSTRLECRIAEHAVVPVVMVKLPSRG